MVLRLEEDGLADLLVLGERNVDFADDAILGIDARYDVGVRELAIRDDLGKQLLSTQRSDILAVLAVVSRPELLDLFRLVDYFTFPEKTAPVRVLVPISSPTTSAMVLTYRRPRLTAR